MSLSITWWVTGKIQPDCAHPSPIQTHGNWIHHGTLPPIWPLSLNYEISAQWCCVDTSCFTHKWQTCGGWEHLIPSCTGMKDLPTVQDGSGKCLTEEWQILNRWTEYCSELYNHKANEDPSVLNCPKTHRRQPPHHLQRNGGCSTITEEREVSWSRQHPSRTGPSRWTGCNHCSHDNLQPDLADRRMANPMDPVLSHHTSQERQPAEVPELPNSKPHQSPK